jgi:hypothetical protein
MIIGLSGKMCAGKDTAAYYLINAYGGQRMAFADYLKRQAQALVLAISGEHINPYTDKRPTIRALLQQLGQAGRAYDPLFWIRPVIANAQALQPEHVYITDVRYPNEVQAIENAGGVVVRISTDDDTRLARHHKAYGWSGHGPEPHESEIALDNHRFLYTVISDDFFTLYADLDRLMAELSIQPRQSAFIAKPDALHVPTAAALAPAPSTQGAVTMRRFRLNRRTDVYGISGVGFIAEGVQFTDGRVALRWIGKYRSTAIYDNINTVAAIHGHKGNTEIEWYDPSPTRPQAQAPHDDLAQAPHEDLDYLKKHSLGNM